jgi:ABC-type multidrug transport system fused ATPase/permease subunit
MQKLIHLLVAGVVLVQSLQVTSFIQFSVRQAAETENYLTSIERVQEYVNLVSEADPTTRPGIIEESWPSQGEIEFKDYVMSYRIDLPPVLNGISFKVDKRNTKRRLKKAIHVHEEQNLVNWKMDGSYLISSFMCLERSMQERK